MTVKELEKQLLLDPIGSTNIQPNQEKLQSLFTKVMYIPRQQIQY